MPAAKKNMPTVEEKWATYERALVITAHPDDAEFMAGGTMAKLADLGLAVTLVVATSGDKGTRDRTLRRQELAAIREEEQRAAAKVLGLHDVRFLGYPDGFLIECEELRAHAVRLIRSLKPDIVITWDGFRPGFNHADHRAIGRAVRDALYPAAHDPHYYCEFEREGIAPWRTAEALFAASNEPDFHVDIGPWLERKIDAVVCHASQVAQANRDDMLTSWRERAKKDRASKKRTGYDFSESFKRIEFRRPEGAPGTPRGQSAAPARRARRS
jgi:LmbE family N-acetylglucosaminyl deacetylase